MQAHILSLHTSSFSEVISNGKHICFLKVVMPHIKIKGMELRAPYKHMLSPYTHPQPVGWVKMNVVMLHIKVKGKKYKPT